MTARLRLPAVLVAALLLVGLLPSLPALAATGSAGSVVVSGRVVDTAGRSVAGAVVTASDGVSGLALFFEAFACVFSFGALLDPLACGPHAVVATSRSDGTFSTRLPVGSPVQRARQLSLSVRGRPVAAGLTGALTTTTTPYDGRSRSLGSVPLWQPELRQTRDGDRVRMDLALPAGTTREPAMRLRSAGEKGVSWHLPVDRSGRVDVDARVLEPGTRSVDGVVEGKVAGRPATFWSAGRPVSPAVPAPVSRGRRCSTYADGGAPFAVTGCPFTDGRLATELGLHAALRLVGRATCQSDQECTAPAAPNAFVVDLGEVRVLRAVTLRDCRCEVELSLDGRRWYPWPREQREGGDDVVVTGAPVPAQQVRVVGDVFTSWDLREVSVFADRPLPAPVTVPPPPVSAREGATAAVAPLAPALPAPIMDLSRRIHAHRALTAP